MKDEIQYILSGKSQVKHCHLIQTTCSYLKRSQRSGSVAQEYKQNKQQERESLIQLMNPHFPAFKRIITNPVLFKFFVFQKLSSAFWAGLSMAHFDEESCGVRVKLSWFNQNPFRSMYFAVEAMAAEMSCGMLAFGQVYKRQPAVSMLVEKLEAKFVKKATGVIIFTCADGLAFQQAVNDALENKEGSKLLSTSIGKNQAGEVVAEFQFTWTFKAKNL